MKFFPTAWFSLILILLLALSPSEVFSAIQLHIYERTTTDQFLLSSEPCVTNLPGTFVRSRSRTWVYQRQHKLIRSTYLRAYCEQCRHNGHGRSSILGTLLPILDRGPRATSRDLCLVTHSPRTLQTSVQFNQSIKNFIQLRICW